MAQPVPVHGSLGDRHERRRQVRGTRAVAAMTTPITTPTVSKSTVPWVDCSHKLGPLPCLNHKQHTGNGRGCIHHSTSGCQDDE